MTGESPLQLVRIRDEAFGYADLSDGFLRLIVIDQGFESDFFRVADSLLKHGGVVLDVGANHGLLSFGLAHRHAHTTAFHLFEPNPKLAESIRATQSLYPSMNCRINAVAVSEVADVVRFQINSAQTGTSHVSRDAGDLVTSVTLDQYLLEQQTDRIALLKIDVEGHELAVLRGALESLSAHRIQAIYFEYFEKNLAPVHAPPMLIEFLGVRGYEVCFCRAADLESRAPSHTLREGVPGHGLPLLPVSGHQLPPMTDLLAVPRENLTLV